MHSCCYRNTTSHRNYIHNIHIDNRDKFNCFSSSTGFSHFIKCCDSNWNRRKPSYVDFTSWLINYWSNNSNDQRANVYNQPRVRNPVCFHIKRCDSNWERRKPSYVDFTSWFINYWSNNSNDQRANVYNQPRVRNPVCFHIKRCDSNWERRKPSYVDFTSWFFNYWSNNSNHR